VGEPAAAIDDLTSEAVAVAAIPEEAALPEFIEAEPLALGIKGTLPFVIAFALQILTFWTVDIVSPAVPNIKDDLAMSATGAGLIFSLFFAGRLAASFPAAFLVERIGTVATAIGGGALIMGGAFLSSIATSELLLFPARALQGAGVALVVCASLVSLLRARPDRGAAMTYFGFGATVGGIIALVTGGGLTELLSWRAVFGFTVVLGIAIIAVAFSARGSLVKTIPPRPAPLESDTQDVDVPSGRGMYIAVLLANFLGFFNYFVWVGVALYADKQFHASSGVISGLLLVVTFVHLFAAFPAGRVIRLRGGRIALIAGLVLSTIGTLLILVPTSAIWLAIPLIPYGVGQVLVTNAAGDLVLHLGGRGRRAIGLLRISGDIGLVVGPFVSGRLMDAVGYGAPFAVLPVITIGAALFFWRGVGRLSRPAVA
jgi:MFS family permease